MIAETSWTVAGFVEQDTRVGIPRDDAAFVERNRSALGVRGEVKPAERVRGVVDTRLLYLGDGESDSAFRLEADALFLEVDRLGGAPLRIRAGRQVVRWGSGLIVNPTSTVGPSDFEDPLRFGQPIGTGMLRGDLTLAGIRVEGVFVPRFTPSRLPEVAPRDALAASGNPIAESIAADEGWNASLDLRVHRPDAELDNAQGAVRLAGTVPVVGVDLAASWYTGRTSIPQPRRVELEVDFVAQTLDGEILLDHPGMHAWGVDARGEIPAGPLGTVGAWAEAAWIQPIPMERITIGNGIETRTREYEDDYARAAVGLDYTTSGGTFLGAQWSRGFLDEFGAEDQGDYVVAVIDRPLFGDRLRVRVVAFGSLDDHSVLFAPDVAWSAADAVTLSLGAYAGFGDRDSKFAGPLVGDPVAIARARLSF